MSGTRWFDLVVMAASYPSEPRVLEAIRGVLDAARPDSIDPARSEVIDGSFLIAHRKDPIGDIEIEVGRDAAEVNSVAVSRRIGVVEFGAGWIDEVARTVDQIVLGRYDIELVRWRGSIVRTVVTVGGSVCQTRSGWGRLPLPERVLVRERVQLDYGCRS